MSYSTQGLGQEPSPEEAASPAATATLPASAQPDVWRPFALELVKPKRGFVAVPSYDLRAYVQSQFITAAVGFGIGVGIGALLGNFLRGRPSAMKILAPNRRR